MLQSNAGVSKHIAIQVFSLAAACKDQGVRESVGALLKGGQVSQMPASLLCVYGVC